MEYLLLYVTGIVITFLYMLIVGEGTFKMPGKTKAIPAMGVIALGWPIVMFVTIANWFAEGIEQ